MKTPIHLAGVVGSLRSDSANRAVFESAVKLAGDGVTLTEVSVRDVPLYDGDVEAVGDPESVDTLKRMVDAADGLIIFTPEYNRSTPAVTKNVIDWLSRLPGQSVLSRATVGIVAATPGNHDAAGVRTHLGASIQTNTSAVFEPSLGIGRIADKVADGQLVDDEALEQLRAWLESFVADVRSGDV